MRVVIAEDMALLRQGLTQLLTDAGLRAAQVIRGRHPKTAVLLLSSYLAATGLEKAKSGFQDKSLGFLHASGVFNFFAYENADSSTIDRLANTFVTTNFDIRSVLRDLWVLKDVVGAEPAPILGGGFDPIEVVRT